MGTLSRKGGAVAAMNGRVEVVQENMEAVLKNVSLSGAKAVYHLWRTDSEKIIAVKADLPTAVEKRMPKIGMLCEGNVAGMAAKTGMQATG